MYKQITCPNCRKKYSNHPVIEDAAAGIGSSMQFIACECGIRLTYWQITDQLRAHQTISARIKNWIRSFSQSQTQG